MNVLISSRIIFVCPNPSTVLVPMDTSIRKEEMYENLWIVDKDAYNSCSIDTSKAENKLLMKCDSPLVLKYYTVVVQQFSASWQGLEFQRGREYYFIGEKLHRVLRLLKSLHNLHAAAFPARHCFPTRHCFSRAPLFSHAPLFFPRHSSISTRRCFFRALNCVFSRIFPHQW